MLLATRPHFSATFLSPSGIKCHDGKRVAGAPPRTRQAALLHSLNPPERAARKAARASKNRKELKKVKGHLSAPAGGTPGSSSRLPGCELNRCRSQCCSFNFFWPIAEWQQSQSFNSSIAEISSDWSHPFFISYCIVRVSLMAKAGRLCKSIHKSERCVGSLNTTGQRFSLNTRRANG